MLIWSKRAKLKIIHTQKKRDKRTCVHECVIRDIDNGFGTFLVKLRANCVLTFFTTELIKTTSLLGIFLENGLLWKKNISLADCAGRFKLPIYNSGQRWPEAPYAVVIELLLNLTHNVFGQSGWQLPIWRNLLINLCLKCVSRELISRKDVGKIKAHLY